MGQKLVRKAKKKSNKIQRKLRIEENLMKTSQLKIK